MKIVVLDGYSANPGDLSWEPLEQLGELIVYPRTLPEEVICRADGAEIVLTNKVVLDSEKLNALHKLKYVGVLATGYNVIDIVAAKTLGIIVTNIPAYSADSVAQMTFAHILNITNRVNYYAEKNRNGRWSYNQDFCYWDMPMHELAEMTIGIVGLGNIGIKVAKLAREFGMDVFAYTSKNSADLPDGIQKTTMDGRFAVSDVLTLHCPLTESTRELINKDSLMKIKRGSILINTGRGQLINEQDVAYALKSGQLSGYGADVLCNEPPVENNPLFEQPNAFITPHIAWATYEARARLMNIAIENITLFINGMPSNVVNI